MNDSAKSGRLLKVRRFFGYKRVMIFLVVLLVINLLGYIAWTKYQDIQHDKKVVHIPSETEFFQKHLSDLLAHPPASDAAINDKTAYYDDLRYTYADTGDYQRAIGAFTKREAISGQGLTYLDYFKVAGYYHRVGDKASAQKMLDKAQSLLPAQDNVDSGYSKDEKVQIIDQYRKEYAR